MDFIIAEMYVGYSFDKVMSFMSDRFILAMINSEAGGNFLRKRGGYLVRILASYLLYNALEDVGYGHKKSL